MKIKSISSPIRSHALKVIMAAAIAATCGFHAEPAKATLPVLDYSALIQQAEAIQARLEEWEKTYAHYQGVMSHYQAQAAFWQQQLNKLRTLDFELLQLEQNFQTIDQNYGVAIMCPGASTSIIDKVTSSLTNLVNPDSDLIGQQKEICANIVRTENRKYNDTVKYLQSLRKQTDELTQLTDMKKNDVGNSPGNTEGLIAEIQRYQSSTQLSKTGWESSMQQYDLTISLLKQQQTVLSRRALNGQNSVWGQIVNTVALKAALTANQ